MSRGLAGLAHGQLIESGNEPAPMTNDPIRSNFLRVMANLRGNLPNQCQFPAFPVFDGISSLSLFLCLFHCNFLIEGPDPEK